MKENKTDPVCGMQGKIPAHGHYFCSERCIRKYEQEHGIKVDETDKKYCPSCEIKPGTPWYKEKLFIFGFLTIFLFIFSFFFYAPLFEALWDYLSLIWWAILLGLLIGGVIEYFIPSSYIMKYLSGRRKRTIFHSVILGFAMSACSHGILAIAMQLHKKGASTSSTIAFLLAAPWANMSITILLFSFFGLKALAIIFSAILIAIIAGLTYQFLEARGIIEGGRGGTGGNEDAMEFSIRGDVKKRWAGYKLSAGGLARDARGVFSGSWALAKMVLWWILIGMIMASFVRAFVPADLFHHYLGATALGLLVTLAFAAIIEVCSEGSSPMAFEIFRQTGAFGNAFVFLTAGVATDYTEIGLIWSNIGRRAAILLPVIAVPQILVLGYLFNVVL